MYTHAFLHRPTRDTLYSKQYSPYLDDIIKLLGEIFNANAQIMDHFNMMVRSRANATHPEQKYIKTSLLLDPQDEEAMYFLIDLELEKSNFSRVKELKEDFVLICSKICEKLQSIEIRLKAFEKTES